MTRRRSIGVFAGPVMAAGAMFALLPGDWIEARLGLSPDGGSGLLEFLASAITLAIGIALAILAWSGSRRVAQPTECQADESKTQRNCREPQPLRLWLAKIQNDPRNHIVLNGVRQLIQF